MQALYRHFESETLLYVGISTNPFRRIKQHKTTSKWFERISRIEIEWYSTRKEVEVAEMVAIKKESPLFNKVYNTGSRRWHDYFDREKYIKLKKEYETLLSGKTLGQAELAEALGWHYTRVVIVTNKGVFKDVGSGRGWARDVKICPKSVAEGIAQKESGFIKHWVDYNPRKKPE